MIFFYWSVYLFFTIIISLLVRKLVNGFFLKRLTFATFFSLFGSVWFSYPGDLFISPVNSIFLLELIEDLDYYQPRLFRPFLALFGFTLIIDLTLGKINPKN